MRKIFFNSTDQTEVQALRIALARTGWLACVVSQEVSNLCNVLPIGKRQLDIASLMGLASMAPGHSDRQCLALVAIQSGIVQGDGDNWTEYALVRIDAGCKPSSLVMSIELSTVPAQYVAAANGNGFNQKTIAEVVREIHGDAGLDHVAFLTSGARTRQETLAKGFAQLLGEAVTKHGIFTSPA